MAKGTTSSNTEVAPTFNLLLLLKEGSGEDFFSLSLADLRTRLCAGVILRDKKNTETQFFWMDKKSNLNCFMLLPKSLTISPDSRQVPCFFSEMETGMGKETTLPRVKYEKVRQLEVEGKFWTMEQSGMESEYEVVLILKATTNRSMGIFVSTKMLSLPDGSKIQKTWERVPRKSNGEWDSIQVGTFRLTPRNIGELSFALQVHFGGRPDIVIRGVAIKPSSLQC